LDLPLSNPNQIFHTQKNTNTSAAATLAHFRPDSTSDSLQTLCGNTDLTKAHPGSSPPLVITTWSSQVGPWKRSERLGKIIYKGSLKLEFAFAIFTTTFLPCLPTHLSSNHFKSVTPRFVTELACLPCLAIVQFPPLCQITSIWSIMFNELPVPASSSLKAPSSLPRGMSRRFASARTTLSDAPSP